MPPDDVQLEEVRELLKECSAHLLSGTDNKRRGTGFFIDEDLLLTCAHVLEANVGDEVVVHPLGRDQRPGTVTDRLGAKEIDLALIETTTVAGDQPQASVLLDRRINDNIDYYAVGYRREKVIRRAGIEEIVLTGTRRIPAEGGGVDLLTFNPGRGSIKGGLSGGAVLNVRSGAVVALVQYSEAKSGNEGGAAIPISRAAKHLPAVAELLENPPRSAGRWREALGEAGWRELGKPLKRQAHLDLFLSGNRSKWMVKVNGKDHPLTVKDLPDTISEAFFQWTQRRYVKNRDDVEFLGQLLAHAIFPEAIAPELRKACSNDELLIRLHVAAESDLFDIPWELATVQMENENGHAGAHERLRLARVADHTAPEAQPLKEGGRVIAAVVQTANHQSRMPTFTYGNNEIQWPEEGHILNGLTGVVAKTQFEVEALSNPKPVTIRSALNTSPPDGLTNAIVHYIGRGEMRGEEPIIALVDDVGDIKWHGVDEFFDWVARSGARLLVVEFTLPPLGIDPEVISPRTFLKALAGSVEAVLFTRFPMHPRHLLSFNEVLYDHLNAGESIESSVQHARNETYVNGFFGADTEFGWFTLITSERAEMCLVEGVTEEGSGAFKAPTPPQPQAPTKDSISLTVGNGDKQ